MPQRSLMAAKTVASLCDFNVTNLILQKLLYLAHMIYLGDHGHALVDGHFEAWNIGPVEPNVYHLLKAYGNNNIHDVFGTDGFPENSTEYETIKAVVNKFRDFKPSLLVQITHQNHGAWAKNFISGIQGMKMSNNDILQEYGIRRMKTGKLISEGLPKNGETVLNQ